MLDLSKNFLFVFSHTSVQLDHLKKNVQNLIPFARRQNNFPWMCSDTKQCHVLKVSALWETLIWRLRAQWSGQSPYVISNICIMLTHFVTKPLLSHVKIIFSSQFKPRESPISLSPRGKHKELFKKNFFYLLINLSTQHGAQSHKPEIKSHLLH